MIVPSHADLSLISHRSMMMTMTADRFTDDKATIRAELEKRAQARATMTYGEAAAMVGRANQGLAELLNAIRDEEAENGRPDLGYLVVRADTGLPAHVGTGYEERERALSTRKAVFAAWKAFVPTT